MTADRPAALTVAVCGGGNAALALAADLSWRGCRVRLLEHPGRISRLDEVRARGGIERIGPGRGGFCAIDHATSDPAVGLADVDLLVVAVPAYAHAAFAELTAPHLRANAIVAVFTGSLGALEWRRQKFRGPIVDVDNLPYTARITAPATVAVHLDVPRLVAAVLPMGEARRAENTLKTLFPALTFSGNPLEPALTNVNGVVHPPTLLLNVSRIDSARGQPWWIWEIGMTPTVARVVERLDDERRAIGAAFGLDLPPVAEVLRQAGYGPGGTVWQTLNGCEALRRIRGPDDLNHRWVSEDIPYALRLWVDLARAAGVACPVARAHVDLACAMTGRDFWAEGRTLARYGLGDLGRAGLQRFFATGEGLAS